MVKLVQLTRFDIETEWDAGKPTNTEKRTPVYVNPDLVQIMMLRPFFVPQADENTYVDKVLIVFGNDMDIYVDETMEEVLMAFGIGE